MPSDACPGATQTPTGHVQAGSGLMPGRVRGPPAPLRNACVRSGAPSTPALTTWPTSAMQISLCWRTPYSRDSVQVTERKCECHEHGVIGSAYADNAHLHGGTMQPYHCKIQYHILCAVCLDAPSVPILRSTLSPADKRKPATISPTSTATRHADARPRLGGLGSTFQSHPTHCTSDLI